MLALSAGGRTASSAGGGGDGGACAPTPAFHAANAIAAIAVAPATRPIVRPRCTGPQKSTRIFSCATRGWFVCELTRPKFALVMLVLMPPKTTVLNRLNSDSSRDPIHFADSVAGSFGPIGRDLAILNQPFSPLLNILDASTALINGGPQGDGSDAVRASPGLVLASRDRIALDAAGVSLIKLELGRNDVPQADAAHETLLSTRPWSFPQIVEAGMRGIGATRAADVDLAFDDVADADALEAIFRA